MLAVKLPVGASKCFPGATSYKHNCVSIFMGIVLYGVIMAFITSLLRLANGRVHFVLGSMCGALYRRIVL